MSRGNSASKKLQGWEVLSLQDTLHCSTLRVLGDVILRTLPYACVTMDEPMRTRNYFWLFTSDFPQSPFWSNPSYQLKTPTYSVWKSSKSGTRKDHFKCLRSPAKKILKCLIKDSLLWHGIMSTNLKNPEDQDDSEKGTSSNQPQLTCITAKPMTFTEVNKKDGNLSWDCLLI